MDLRYQELEPKEFQALVSKYGKDNYWRGYWVGIVQATLINIVIYLVFYFNQ